MREKNSETSDSVSVKQKSMLFLPIINIVMFCFDTREKRGVEWLE